MYALTRSSSALPGIGSFTSEVERLRAMPYPQLPACQMILSVTGDLFTHGRHPRRPFKVILARGRQPASLQARQSTLPSLLRTVRAPSARSPARAGDQRSGPGLVRSHVELRERELGVALFDRIGRTIALTEARRHFLAEATAILQHVGAFERLGLIMICSIAPGVRQALCRWGASQAR